MIKDFKENTCLLVDMSTPTHQNIAVKEFDKLSKHKDLEIENGRVLILKATTVPMIVDALGMIEKGYQKHLDKIPGQSQLQKTQQIVLTILRNTLSVWISVFFTDVCVSQTSANLRDK